MPIKNQEDFVYYKKACEVYFQCCLDNYQMVYLAKPRGAFLCYEGGPIEHLMFFVEGRAKVFRTLSNGGNLLYDFYEPLSVLGDLELFSGAEYYQTCVQALTDCICLGIPIQENKEQLLKDISLLRAFGKELAVKLNRCSQNAIINQLESVEYRLADFILKTAHDHVFNEHLGDTADLLGISYRHLLRTIRGLCDKGVLTKTNAGYAIMDYDGLLEITHNAYDKNVD